MPHPPSERLSKGATSLFSTLSVVVLAAATVVTADSWVEPYRPITERIIAEATSGGTSAWNRLAELTDRFPARLSGSVNLQRAVEWIAARMKDDGLDNVRLEPVLVPHWVRGAESAEIVAPFPQQLVIATLGGSVGTSPDGIEADTIVVRNYDELEAQGSARVRGKIVVYNFVFPTDVDPLTAYLQGMVYRTSGASRAGRLGAVAALVRSVGPTANRTPHTGSMRYSGDGPKIPTAAVAAEDADKMQRMQDRGQPVRIRLRLGAQTLPDVESANVVAELRGRERPDEIVLIGGHIDSWDLAAGAMDDAGGVVATWEALRVLKKLNLVPRRTIRVVAFVNEENGARGGQAYRDTHAGELSRHVLALESDNGVLPLRGWGFSGTSGSRNLVHEAASLLKGLDADTITDGFDGTDIEATVNAGVPGISPNVDMRRYFVIHHTPADTPDKVDPVDLGRAVAAIASLAYVVADMPQTLEHAPAAGPGTGRAR